MADYGLRHGSVAFLPAAFAACLCVVLSLASSCSTTRVLAEDETRLMENKIVLHQPKGYDEQGNPLPDVIVKEYEGIDASSLAAYAKQRPNTYFIGKWNPFISVYNWSDDSDSGWDRFVKKLGQEPVVFDQNLIPGSKKGMLSHLEEKGFYFSTIDHEVVSKKRKSTVTYNVYPGCRYTIRDIDYLIPDGTMEELLHSDSANFTIFRGDILSQEALENESDRMAQFFRNNGYYGFSKNYFFYYADTTQYKGEALLSVKIEDYTRNESPSYAKPHRQYYFRNVSIVPTGDLRYNPEFLNSLNLIKPNTLYSEQLVNTTYDRFSSVGLYSSVNISLQEVDSTGVDCRIMLSPGKQQGAKLNLESSVNASGLLGITPSISYYHKNLFHGGEYFAIGLRGNFQFKPKDPARSSEFAVTTSLSFPKFLLLPQSIFKSNIPRTEIAGVFNHQSRPEYNRTILSASYGYNWRASRKLFFQMYPLQFNTVKMSRVDSTFTASIRDPYLKSAYRSHFDLGSSFLLYYTTDPSTNPTTSYFYTRFQFDIAGNALSMLNDALYKDNLGERLIWGVPYSQFVRGELQAVRTLRFGKSNKMAFASRALIGVGVGYGNSRSLPFEKLFYAGGANSMRGWQARSLGPGGAPRDSSFSIPNQTGDMHLEFDAELRHPLFWKLDGAIFVEAGNVWNLGYEDIEGERRDPLGLFSFKTMLNTCALDWGIGMRLDFGLLLVRVDWGMKIYDPLDRRWVLAPFGGNNEGAYAIHFGIGYPF